MGCTCHLHFIIAHCVGCEAFPRNLWIWNKGGHFTCVRRFHCKPAPALTAPVHYIPLYVCCEHFQWCSEPSLNCACNWHNFAQSGKCCIWSYFVIKDIPPPPQPPSLSQPPHHLFLGEREGQLALIPSRCVSLPLPAALTAAWLRLWQCCPQCYRQTVWVQGSRGQA